MTNSPLTQQALNKAMMEAVDFIHAEGWDAAPTLFALVPSSLLIDALPSTDGDDDTAPLTLVVQDSLPANLGACSRAIQFGKRSRGKGKGERVPLVSCQVHL